MDRFPIRDRRIISPKKPAVIGGTRFKAYRVEHSIRAPAVGYRVSAKAGSFFYLPDVARLPNPQEALRGIGVYIGDGATLRRTMVRIKNGVLIGHAPIATQLGWCAKAHVHKAIFTHCGSPIVRGMRARSPRSSVTSDASTTLMRASPVMEIGCVCLNPIRAKEQLGARRA